MLRTLFRDPLVSRPLRRAIKRMEDDLLFDELPILKVRRASAPFFEESPRVLMDSMSRRVANVMDKMQEDLETLDSWISGEETRRAGRAENQCAVRRTESGGLQLALDVADFRPEDLKIKLEDDNLIIEANNEQSSENSYQKSHFKRWFKLPDGCDQEQIRSKLTGDGRLLVDLPSAKPIEDKAREIPIEVEKKRTEAIQDKQQQNGGNQSQDKENSSLKK